MRSGKPGRVIPSRPPAGTSAPGPACACSRLADRLSHMAGTRRGLARRAGRRALRRPGAGKGVEGLWWRGYCRSSKRRPPGEGARAEGLVPSGQGSWAPPRGLGGLPTPSFPTHGPTHARARPLAPRACKRTPARPDRPRPPQPAHAVTRHELTPLHAHRTVHTSCTPTPHTVPCSLRLNINQAMAQGSAAEAVERSSRTRHAPCRFPLPPALWCSLWNPDPTPQDTEGLFSLPVTSGRSERQIPKCLGPLNHRPPAPRTRWLVRGPTALQVRGRRGLATLGPAGGAGIVDSYFEGRPRPPPP